MLHKKVGTHNIPQQMHVIKAYEQNKRADIIMLYEYTMYWLYFFFGGGGVYENKGIWIPKYRYAVLLCETSHKGFCDVLLEAI